jgi:predicted glycoside hydrolase/deacetylase ChbG (UPF0249 family)
LIITADDLGLNHAVNAAIFRAFDQDLITHASVMSNMPAFESAVYEIANQGLADRIGGHLVVTAGLPLTNPIRSIPRFCDNEGYFRYWCAEDRGLHLRSSERHALKLELTEQIRRCREMGLTLSHLDSHHHVHTKPAIGMIVTALARHFGIKRVRLVCNAGRRTSWARKRYGDWFNEYVRRAGLSEMLWCGDAADYLRLRASGHSALRLEKFEVITHPVLQAGRLVDAETPERPFARLVEESERQGYGRKLHADS